MESSMQMRLYSLTKQHFVLVFVVFILSFLLTALAGLAGPVVLTSTSVNSSSTVTSPDFIPTGPFLFFSPVLTTFNQEIWLLTNMHINNAPGTIYGHQFELNVTMFAIDNDGSGGSGLTHSSHIRTLNCQGQGFCEPIVVLHLGYLSLSRFRVKITFEGLENKIHSINDIIFQFKTYNPTFTQVEIWFRFVFLVLTFIVTCLFAHTLRKYHMKKWSMEQKWISVLLPLLLLYNDPIFPLSFLVKSWIPGMLDAFLQATFLCVLLLFWLCIYHGIRSTGKKQFLTFYFPKLIICGLFWLSAVTLGSWQQYNELRDPTYQYTVDIKNFKGMKIFFFLMAGLYVLYLGFLLIRAFTELHGKPYFTLRLKFLTILTACVFSISLAIVILRFGSSVLQDNFTASISSKYHNSAEFMCFYGLINFYTYTMAFVYSPTKNALTEPVFRSDTGFTLLNESDEDVLYGYVNNEETPLNNGNSLHSYYDSDN